MSLLDEREISITIRAKTWSYMDDIQEGFKARRRSRSIGDSESILPHEDCA